MIFYLAYISLGVPLELGHILKIYFISLTLKFQNDFSENILYVYNYNCKYKKKQSTNNNVPLYRRSNN